jgi:hypothetical protein
MKNQQRAKKKPRLTLREQYRQLAIRLLKKERTKILDIQTLQELIELEIGRSMKKDELIAAFSRKDCGLEIVPQEKITWVIFHKPAAKAVVEKKPIPEKVPAKRVRKAARPESVAEVQAPKPEKALAKKPTNSRKKRTAKPKESEAGKLSPAEFTLKAIQDLRKPPHKGIHTVYSDFNAGFRKYFPDLDPVQTVAELSEKGIVVNKLARGGALLYIPGESPKAKANKEKKAKKAKIDKGEEALKKMGLA